MSVSLVLRTHYQRIGCTCSLMVWLIEDLEQRLLVECCKVILDGMITSLSNGFNRVVIHTDNLEVVQALQDDLLEDSGITILKRVQRIMSTERRWLIRHIPREENRVAVCLVKLSVEGRTGL
ncbi:hypothetical protein Godav_002394 [Gossypium davidsonii]|uniref:RNase H type-1 domain-containing protein n=2 Tax=Gossypium TaxID=3633 RepID=A0A7J8SW10_GOSDV|nr:hypothetical protein [Gossypium davidsonii]